MQLEPGAIVRASDWARDVAAGVPPDRWDRDGDGGPWSPRRSVDHCVDALLLYAAHISRRATHRLPPPRNGDPGAGRADLLDALRSAAAVLAEVVGGMPAGARAFHPSGRADATGWIGMACTELLVHGHDVATTAGAPGGDPPVELAAAVVRRVLPWAPDEGDGWQQLLWATGRRPLADRPPAAADWWWQSAPLSEWDGRPRRRDAPPQW